VKGSPRDDGTAGPRLPPGFAALVGRAGIRSGPGDDVVALWATQAASSAAVFTRSRFAGPSVTLSRAHAAGGRARGVVVVAGNANEPRSGGPPRVTEEQLRKDFSADFEFEWLKTTRFDTRQEDRAGALAWAVLLRRK